METDLHVKPTDRDQYLHHSSSYLEHTKRFIVFSQRLRVSRICSYVKDFRKHSTEMRSWSKSLVEKETSKVKFSGYTRRNKREKKGILFVITYHPNLKNIGRIINQNYYILYINEEVKSVHITAPTISFHSARKLSSY